MRIPLPKTLRNRIAFVHALIAFVAMFALTLYAAFVIFNSSRRHARMDVERLGVIAASALEEPLVRAVREEGSFGQVEDELRDLFRDVPQLGYTIYLTDGIPVLADNDSLPLPADPSLAPEIWTALENDTGIGEQVRRNSQGQNVYYLALRIRHEDQTAGVLRLELSLETWDQEAWRNLTLLFSVAAMIWLVMSLAGWLLAWGLTRPLVRLVDAAERLSKEELEGGGISPRDPQEVQQLGTAIHSMLTRLQSQVGELRSFVSNASHELRTPLTSIKLRVEALRHGALKDPPVAERFLSEVENEIDRVTLLVNDMLDLSRLEAGLKPEDHGPVDLSSLVEEVCDTFQARAERGGVSLACRIQPDLPELLGSEVHLRRLLYNLVDNAIKYTPPEGRVRVSLNMGKQKGNLRLVVKDTGHGIAPTYLPHIFERFYRVEATRPRHGYSKGSGLGLPISKSIVEAHGGQIGVTSQVGQGSTFWVELPIESDGGN